ncbi:hypothetical protein FJR06_15770 [Dolichospermum sp. UHCC 0352]|uniref:hypothetical protein n=1 Tax=Dolichospermum sp. UHCC 0352 TaxID=2590011 RepID=UPI0014463711|nr:hypothetical protein [Dolichospermum sp. UHCC 0352]MTJ22697.1 hypothetical protein [Dolichospermum sp. UHCC 0352]
MSSYKDNRPQKMYRMSHPVDMSFDENEKLYNRCQKEHINGERLLPTGIKFPDWSVNREKYSDPEDVLVPNFFDWGIAQFKVSDVPEQIESPGNIKYDFRVEHDPTEDNYAHSEVRTYKDGNHSKKLEVNKTVKKLFRQMLSEKTVIIKQSII